jgi:hypothetical protein
MLGGPQNRSGGRWENSWPYRNSKPVEPAASRYTDWAIPSPVCIYKCIICHFFLLSLPVWSTGLISQFHDHFTDGRTPCAGDQLVARPLPVHRTTHTQKRIHTSNMHALCRIRTHDPVFRVKTVHVLDRSVTMTGIIGHMMLCKF